MRGMVPEQATKMSIEIVDRPWRMQTPRVEEAGCGGEAMSLLVSLLHCIQKVISLKYS